VTTHGREAAFVLSIAATDGHAQHFAPCHGVDLALVDNKDSVLFPAPV
jgi:hypothetical protein